MFIFLGPWSVSSKAEIHRETGPATKWPGQKFPKRRSGCRRPSLFGSYGRISREKARANGPRFVLLSLIGWLGGLVHRSTALARAMKLV